VARQDVVNTRVAKLIAGFGQYVQTYDDYPPFTPEQLRLHRATIALREQADSVCAAVQSDRFIQSLYATLRAWRIGQRQSRLIPVGAFAGALRAALPSLEQVEPLVINGAGLPPGLTEHLWQLVYSLDVVENEAKIVAGTKTLHHLLPDLVPPMDREYTREFFGFHNPQFGDLRQPAVFRVMYNHLAEIAQVVRPEQYVTGAGWRTSRTKILDNAVVAYCRIESGEIEPSPGELSGAQAANTISFDVQGLPPPKDGGTSIFNSGHRHLGRVRLLLEAARQACAIQNFRPIESRRVGLEVVLYTPPEQNPADAANYLGGIADVLEDKGLRAIDHLGDLGSVWLYRNDKQIKEISFREVGAAQVGYRVTITELGS
jgi:hypothetical protein